MYKSYDMANGLPIRIYREPREIKRDIMRINGEIEDIREMINIRSLVMDILVSERREKPEELIPELSDAIGEAERALRIFKELSEELSSLKEELYETRCRIKV